MSRFNPLASHVHEEADVEVDRRLELDTDVEDLDWPRKADVEAGDGRVCCEVVHAGADELGALLVLITKKEFEVKKILIAVKATKRICSYKFLRKGFFWVPRKIVRL